MKTPIALALLFALAPAAHAGHGISIHYGGHKLDEDNVGNHDLRDLLAEQARGSSESIELAESARLCYKGDPQEVYDKLIAKLGGHKAIQSHAVTGDGRLTVELSEASLAIPPCKGD